MDKVYLGIFSWIFDKIWNSILKPVIDFIGELLNSILSLLFDKVLKPLLINVFFPMFKDICKMVFDALCDILFEVYVTLLKLIDYLCEVFNIFGGITNVTYNGKETYLLSALFSMAPIMKAMWFIIALSFCLLLMFSIIAVIRSIGELGNEVQRPVAKVLRSTFDGFLKIITAPLVCIFLIMFMQMMLVSLHNGITSGDDLVSETSKGSQTSLGRIIFVVSSLNASTNSTYNISTASGDFRNTLGINDAVRAQYYYSDYKVNGIDASKDFSNLNTVKKDFKPQDIDYLIGIALALLFAFTIARGAMTFVARLFNIIILTIVAPIFGGTVPLDDGQKYEKWKDMYIGQLFSGFGLVLAMEMYLLLIPVIMDNRLAFGKGTIEANYLIRVIFLAAGAYMVMQVGPIITGLVSESAASAEMSNNRTFGGAIFAAASYAKGTIVGDKSNKAVAEVKVDAKTGKPIGNKSDAKKGGANGDNTKAANNKAQKKNAKGDVQDAINKRAADDEKVNKGVKVREKTDEEKEKEKKEALANAPKTKEEAAKQKAQKPGVKESYFGGIFVRGKGKDGKDHWGINLGKRFNFGLKEDGTVSGNVFGIGWKRGKDGKIDKVSVPFMRFKRGEDGKFAVSKIKISQGMQLRRTEHVETDKDGNIVSRKMGGMYVSDLSAIGMKRRYDANTGKVETQSMLGTHYRREKNKDGKYEYVKSYRNFLGTTSVYERDNTGEYHVTARKGFLSDRTYSLNKKTGKRKTLKVSSLGGRSLYEANDDDDDDDDDGGEDES
ncbi:MAG: hypothetical protein J6U50_07785 [Lachnospiraceae bacterium]|nr:hypothetical protein [Lachnospiraceae bacterium]